MDGRSCRCQGEGEWRRGVVGARAGGAAIRVGAGRAAPERANSNGWAIRTSMRPSAPLTYAVSRPDRHATDRRMPARRASRSPKRASHDALDTSPAGHYPSRPQGVASRCTSPATAVPDGPRWRERRCRIGLRESIGGAISFFWGGHGKASWRETGPGRSHGVPMSDLRITQPDDPRAMGPGTSVSRPVGLVAPIGRNACAGEARAVFGRPAAGTGRRAFTPSGRDFERRGRAYGSHGLPTRTTCAGTGGGGAP